MEMRTGTDMLSHMQVPDGLTRRYVSIYLVYLAIASQTFRRLKQHLPDMEENRAAVLAFQHSAITFVDRDDFEQDVADIAEDLRVGDEASESEDDSHSGSKGSQSEEDEGSQSEDDESELDDDSQSEVTEDSLKELYEDCLASDARFRSWEPDNRIQSIIKNSVIHASCR